MAFVVRLCEHESAFCMVYTDVCVPCACNANTTRTSEASHVHIVNLKKPLVLCANPTCPGVRRDVWMYAVMRDTTDCTGRRLATSGLENLRTTMNALGTVAHVLDRELIHANTVLSTSDLTVSEDFSLLADAVGLTGDDRVEDTWLPSVRLRLEGCPTVTLEADDVMSPTQ